MKNIIKYFIFLLPGMLIFSACEINDPVDELVRTGYMGANVYYETGATNSKAGADVPFYTEYWSVDDRFNNLELWYGIQKSLKYGLTSGVNDYSLSLDSAETARESQVILEYEHVTTSYDVEKAAYIIDDSFPVSYTLAPTIIENPGSYDEGQVTKLFPASFIEQFYDGLFETLDYELLQLILVERAALIDQETFDTHFDDVEIIDPDTEEVIGSEKVMKEESKPVLYELFSQVPLQDLIYNPNTFAFQILYSRIYTLESQFRVVNGNDVEVFSELKAVEIN
ncbi:hypothetical protein [Carboxylicivirga sp. RSCT41]|uniref:hypothetical protein n=1 Tax=Carboxylicivirga agarovorans TaxID=3417570 RepID=UPI003D341E2B